MIALIEAMLGEPDLEALIHPSFPSTRVFLISFLIVNAILMLNLLIALLLEDYSSIKS